MTKRELLDILDANSSETNIDLVIKAICVTFKITLDQFQNDFRGKIEISDARAMASFFLNKYDLKNNEIAFALRPHKPQDRTTIVAHLRKAKAMIKYNEDFKIKYHLVKDMVKTKDDEIILPDEIIIREYEAYLKRKENDLTLQK